MASGIDTPGLRPRPSRPPQSRAPSPPTAAGHPSFTPSVPLYPAVYSGGASNSGANRMRTRFHLCLVPHAHCFNCEQALVRQVVSSSLGALLGSNEVNRGCLKERHYVPGDQLVGSVGGDGI